MQRLIGGRSKWDADGHETMSPITVARSASIDGCRIFVLDDVVSEGDAAVLHLILNRSQFTRTERASKAFAEYKHWVTSLDLDATAKLAVAAVARRAVAELFPGPRTMFRAYCNVALFGDMLFAHRDCAPGNTDVTALYYVCTDWNIDWGGETVFFDVTGDVLFAVTPRPRRMVLFDGAINHVGRPPNRICFEPRYTLALKFRSDAAPVQAEGVV